MKYCAKCKVNVAGNREKCPLCQSSLTALDREDREEVFPFIKKKKGKLGLFLKIFLLVSFIAIVTSIIVNVQVPESGNWCKFVVCGIICAWICIGIAIKKRKNILKNIFYETSVIALFAVFWDAFTGWHNWSLEFAVPIIFVVSMLLMALLSRVMRICAEEHLVYLCVLILFGVIPQIFLVRGMLAVKLPSLICVGIGGILFFILLLFEGKKMWQELKKRLHI
ncbi:MAG: hypothetical protein J6M02_03645 [Clostridia bacterium]|nr:hypothetical protein [Clostridia bacterium]